MWCFIHCTYRYWWFVCLQQPHAHQPCTPQKALPLLPALRPLLGALQHRHHQQHLYRTAEDEMEGRASRPWRRGSRHLRTSSVCPASSPAPPTAPHHNTHSPVQPSPVHPVPSRQRQRRFTAPIRAPSGGGGAPGTTHQSSHRPGAAAAAASLGAPSLAANGACAWGAAPRAARRPPSWAAPAVTRRGGRKGASLSA